MLMLLYQHAPEDGCAQVRWAEVAGSLSVAGGEEDRE